MTTAILEDAMWNERFMIEACMQLPAVYVALRWITGSPGFDDTEPK